MKRFCFLFFILAFYAKGQIAIKNNLPEKLSVGQEFNMEVRILKGSIKNFSKYQLIVPEGLNVQELDSKTGTFTFENGRAQIIWAITPAEAELVFTMKIIASNAVGEKTLTQKFNYLEKGDKREVEGQTITLNIIESNTSGAANISETTTKVEEVKIDTSISINDGYEEVKQQINQLRRDSKEAYEIGGREKKNALARITEADKVIKSALTISNVKERKAATDKAMAAKTIAQNDLEVANRILGLAKSLEENASEIEKLNQSIDSIGVNSNKPANDQLVNSSIEVEKVNSEEIPKDSKEFEKEKEMALKAGEKDATGLFKPYRANTNNIGEIQQQVMQIKKDSKQAREVGEAEKKKAELKLAHALEALKLASYMPEIEEKKIAIDKANAEKLRAEKDLEIAAKILILAKSLENNANDIEKLNVPEVKQAVAVSSTNQLGLNAMVKEVILDIPDEKEIAKKEPTNSSNQSVSNKPENPALRGLVYRVQIGSFVKSPNKSDFKPIGKVEVLKEEGLYKALSMPFNNKEDASKFKQEIISKGFDGFVVTYQNGKRVK